MKRTCFLILLLASASLSSMAGRPYEFHWLNMGVTEDMATSAVISWATYEGKPASVAQIAPMCNTPKIKDKARDVEVLTIFTEGREIGKKTYPAEYWHRAFFTGLTPETQYLFRVGDGSSWSEWCEFKTAAASGKPFRFIYIGDVQAGINDVYPRIARKAFMAAPDAAFVTFVGDLTGGISVREFDDFFKANGWMVRQMPVAAVADAHEHEGFEIIFHLWERIFAYPGNAPGQAKKEGMYYFDYQDCRFISVDASYFHSSREGLDEAFAWLESILKDNPCTWTVVAHHQPFYSTGRIGRKEIVEFRKPLKELYSKYGVDLILSAHDHQYSRFTEKDRNGRSVVPAEVVSQSGGKCYVPIYNSHADRIATGTQNYQIVEVSGKELIYKSYLADGTLYDSFVIRNRNGKKKFVDTTPDVPEKTDLDYTASRDERQEAEALKRKAAYEAAKRK